MYTLYGTTRSRAFRVMWTLEELGQPYEMVEAAPRSPEILAVNPSGKVPALDVDGTILTDSVAIMSYLADKHGGLTLPAGTVERAHQDALLHRLNDEFDSVLWMATRHMRILPEDRRVPEVVETFKWEFANGAARLSQDFVGPFLQGEEITIADILAVHCMGWAHGIEFGGMDDTLRDYSKMMRARPAFRAAGAKLG
ncbi:MAG: glutathione S-transferase family protein [Paracoccaceae bacterium]